MCLFLAGFMVYLIYYMCDFDAVQDIFERHKVVFTIATSIASVATAWAGEFWLNFFFFNFSDDVLQWFGLLCIEKIYSIVILVVEVDTNKMKWVL